MQIVKLGGSLHHHPLLASQLHACAQQAACIVVPGGGIYADRVRHAQKQAGFSDALAHWQAIDAMDEMALQWHQLAPNLDLVRSLEQMLQGIAAGRSMLWLPSPMLRLDQALPRNWQVTSDSIALWLAQQFVLHAQRAQQDLLLNVTLIKAILPQRGDLAAMQQEQLLDGYFDQMLAQLTQQAATNPLCHLRVMLNSIETLHKPPILLATIPR